ncbi:MAG: DNA topoisomerase I [Thermodesulfobacteriota bacterium]|nr:DNA topoisomerase I [Thermodesulfobacteriota bacterium]
MDDEYIDKNEIDPFEVRVQLDEILAKEITSFIEIDSDMALLSYNLATISCLLIAVEREREIKSFADFPPERYTRKSFTDELVDIGLEEGAKLKESVDSVIQRGYISVDSKDELQAEVSAYTMVSFLDNMFPGMQGMNFIAFVMQMNDEVVSGRKSLEDAKKSFAQTLKSRGVSVTKEKVEAKTVEPVTKKSFKESKKVSEKLKSATAKRLSTLRYKRTGSKPSFYSSDLYASDRVEVKDLFDKGPSKEELAAREAAKRRAEKEAREADQKAEEFFKREETIKEAAKEAEERAKALESREQELAAAEAAAKEAAKRALEIKDREAEMEVREAQLKAMEDRFKSAEEERIRIEHEDAEKNAREEAEKKAARDEDVDAKIAAFQAELAMPCPLCHTGTIVSEKTPAGKDYYTCSNNDCRFVSWDKPYHFSCPLCKNSYLVEIDTALGKGLKCPRASCSYSQENLLDPAQNAAAMANAAPKKKKKVVRRVKKRR